eukprot:g159.t1
MSRVHPAGDGGSPGIQTQKSMFQKSIENAPNSAISFVATSTSFLLGLMFAVVWMCEMLFLMYAFPATTDLWTMARVGATWRHPANGSYVYMSKTEEWAQILSGESNPTCMQDVQFSTFPNVTSEFMVAYGTVKARAFAKSCGGGAITQYTSVEEEANAAAFERYMDLRVHFGESNSSEDRNAARQIWESDDVQCDCKIIEVVANSAVGEWFIKDFFIGTSEDNVDAINGWHTAIKFKRSFDENVNVGTSEHPKTVSCCSCYSTSGNSIATPADCSGFNKDDLDESYFLPNRNLWKAMIGWDLLGVQAAILAALLCPYAVFDSFKYYIENFKKTFAISMAIAGRFSSYSVAKYGKEDGHIISHKHYAHKAFFVLQFIYSAYMRAMVIGMAGPTDVVGSSITKRWSLIVSAILSCAVTIGTRMTTKQRDRFMYKIFHCGRKSLPDDFFEDPHVAKFLNRDMLLLETFADITTLTGLTIYTLLFELFIGVEFGDALASACLNYFIQLLFEQVGNFCIFYFRERKGVFSNEFKEKAGEVRNEQAETDGLTKILENLKNVARGTRKLVNETVWFMLLAMPYVTLLLGKLVGGSLTRGLSIEYSVEDYPHDYVE